MARAFQVVLAMAIVWVVAADVVAQPRIELVTFGPGVTVPESFGHSAIRVIEGEDDRLYNLGHTDAGGIGFFVDLAIGRAEFVGIERQTEPELARYRAVDRSIRRQPLAVDEDRARWLADELRSEVGARRFSYRYDYLRDNCTTEVRDLLDVATDGALRRQAVLADQEREHAPTYRELTMAGFSGHFEVLLGSDLLTGPEQDRPISRWEEMYLPEPLHDTVADVPDLAPESVVLFTRHGPPVHHAHVGVARLAVLFLSLVVGVLLVLARFRDRFLRAAGVGLFFVTPMIAAAGLGAWFLMSMSSLPDLTWNENGVIMWPTDIVLLYPAIQWIRRRAVRRPALVRGYLLARLAAIAGMLVAKLSGWAIQDNVSFILATVLVLAGTLTALRRNGRPDAATPPSR